MTDNKSILIKNVYYMLTYAFQVLRQTNYDHIASEDFGNIHDLLAAILARGIAQQLKQGLYREYVPKVEDFPVMRGKLITGETIRNKLRRKQVLSCQYDEISENNAVNQVLKTAVFILLRQPTIKTERRIALKRVMLFFDGVDFVA